MATTTKDRLGTDEARRTLPAVSAMKTEISLASRVKINEEVLFQELQGEAVLLNLKSGVYLGLDSVGTRIWNLLQQHRVLQEVRDAMLQEHEGSAAQC